MAKRAKEGTCLRSLVLMAKSLLQQAERQCPRTGPGRKPEIPDAVLGVLMMVAVAHRKKRKAAQVRFLCAHRAELQKWLEIKRFPSRSMYYRRYRRIHGLFRAAIRLQGERAVAEGFVDPHLVAVDKSLIAAQGPEWHHSDRRAGRIPRGLRGVDRDSTWSRSQHDGWVQGYGYEVVVSATAKGVVFPLLATADTANASEHHTFGPKIEQLPEATQYVLADAGYDNNEYGEQVEYNSAGQRTERRFVCPQNPRSAARSPKRRAWPRSKAIRQQRQRRRQRRAFYESRLGRRLFRRRGQTVEPFHDWFKAAFELDAHVWHRGLDNNRTQLLVALFTYQLLVRYNHRRGKHNGQIRGILDGL